MRRFFLVSPMILLLIFTVTAVGYAKVNLPVPSQYVVDYAGVINSTEENSLNSILRQLEQKTGAQYIVLTVKTTEGVPIAQYSVELFDKWKLGQKGQDNGMLFVIATKDRKYWFTPGYGLEGFLTDAYCDRVGRNTLVPFLKQNNYSQGIYQANLEVVKKIAGQYGVALTGMPKGSPVPVSQRRKPLCVSILPLLFIMFFIFGGRGMGWFLLPLMFGGFGGYGRSGSYGGGSFGGGFGGFGGGMGGGCSGGGAGGSW